MFVPLQKGHSPWGDTLARSVTPQFRRQVRSRIPHSGLYNAMLNAHVVCDARRLGGTEYDRTNPSFSYNVQESAKYA